MIRRACLALLLLAGCAGDPAPPPRAEGPGSGGPPERMSFGELDANRDAQVDGEEFALLTRRLFTRLDADGDGNLSEEEYAHFAARPGGRPGGMRRGPPGQGGPPPPGRY